jgi:hypothetical protein
MHHRAAFEGLLLLLITYEGCHSAEDEPSELEMIIFGVVALVIGVCVAVYFSVAAVIRVVFGPPAWGKEDWKEYLPDLTGEWERVAAWWIAWVLSAWLWYFAQVGEWHWILTVLSILAAPVGVACYCLLIPPSKTGRATSASVKAVWISLVGVFVVSVAGPVVLTINSSDDPDSNSGRSAVAGSSTDASPAVAAKDTTTDRDESKTAGLLEKESPQEETVVVKLDEDSAAQIRLFPGDEVEVLSRGGTLYEVWFGEAWEKYDPARRYLVSGLVTTNGPEPITPKFEGTGTIKVKVYYTRYRDQQRDIATRAPLPVPKK